MLLRSSSTPVIATRFSPFSDSPNREFDGINNNNCNKQPAFHDHISTKLSSSHGKHDLRLSSFSCNSSPVPLSPSGSSEFDRRGTNFCLGTFRRSRSEGNLEGLVSGSCDIDEFRCSNTLTRSWQRHKSMLKTVPSFSIFNSTDGFEDGEEKEQEDRDTEDSAKCDVSLVRSVTIGDSIEAITSGEFSFVKNSMDLIEEEEGEDEEEEGLNGIQKLGIEEEAEPVSPPLYLATGLGIDATGFGGGRHGGGVDFSAANFNEGGDVEKYYEKMVDEFSCHPLILRNYAQLLQSKGDLSRAEEYYLRATLADPRDGEILMQYAELVWELHHDQYRALSYFELATQASPQDSHVLAAYARFLWEIDDDEDDNSARQDQFQAEEEEGLNEVHQSASRDVLVSPSLHHAGGVGINKTGFQNGTGVAAAPGEGGNVEEYYKRMVEESPCNPLFLRNYAQFLSQSKGDLQRAEEYYLRAMLASPGDGEIMSQYAKLVWEIHHDQDKALCYFERAVRASPENSHVLAAYASFLWETEEDEEEHSAQKDDTEVPLFHGAIASANA